MELSELKSLVADGKIFSVKFIRRTDGAERKMLCRTGVRPAGGGERAYDPSAHNLLLVWDMQKKGYRTIPADNVLSVRAHGRETLTSLATRRPGR